MFDNVSDTSVVYAPDNAPNFPLLSEMYVERGDKKDWDALHHLHYKSQGQPFGPRYWKLVLNEQTIGVTVLTMPKGMLKERHVLFKKFKPGRDSKAANTARYQLINARFRVVGRIVLDTMYRGVGASYRFQNLVARMSGFQVIEIQSAMSKYNHFAQRAGFEFAPPMRSNKYDIGVKFFRETFASHPADTSALLAEIEALPEISRNARLKATRRFYYAHSAQEKTGSSRDTGEARVASMTTAELITNMQQMILASPLYGAYKNPDYGRKDMPDRLPLSAFDNQPTDEPLIL